MASLTLSNIPEELYSHLVRRASLRGRSIEEEAVECLDAAVKGRLSQDVEVVLADLDRFRNSLNGLRVTEEDLQRAKREGRP